MHITPALAPDGGTERATVLRLGVCEPMAALRSLP